MQTAKETGQMMQCPCGMVGFGVEPTRAATFRDRTFVVTSKDRDDEQHTARFTWTEDNRRSVGTCQDTGMTNR